MSLWINSKHSDSVTVSLRTTNYREAMNNSKYLKDQLLAKAGSYLSFEHMREDLKTTARECLQRQGTEWFFNGALKEAQEAIPSVTTDIQLAYLSEYMGILKKGLEGDTQSLINTVVNTHDNNQPVGDSVTFESNSNSVSQTFSSYVETFINDKVSNKSWTEATAKAQGSTLRKLCEHVESLKWSAKPITQITREDLLELRTVLIESGLKTSTVNAQCRNLQSVFLYAETTGLISKSPAVKLQIKDRTKKESKGLTEETILSVIDYSMNDYINGKSKPTVALWTHLKHLPALGAITGARLNELLQLRKGDIKTTSKGNYYIDINANNGNVLKNAASARLVPLIDKAYGFDLKNFLEELVDSCDNDTDFIFRNTHKDRQKYSIKIAHMFQDYRKSNKEAPDNITMHSLRHSMATLCLNKKMPESFAKEILGHAQSITYGLYGSAGVDVDTLHEEMSKLWS